ncbi:hypothetical protein Tco_0246946 [Tanacetum coccineum]
MLNKDNYVPWSSHLLRYANSKPNKKLLEKSILHGLYTDDELTEKDAKQVEANDQAIQIFLMGLPKDVYAVLDTYQTARETWLHVQQMMKGYDIGEQEKKAKLFNEWERFKSTEGESIESYYYHFSKMETTCHYCSPNEIFALSGLHPVVRFLENESGRDANGWSNGEISRGQYDGMKSRNQIGYKYGNRTCINARNHENVKRLRKSMQTAFLMANLQQASTSSTHIDKAPVYDSNGSAENDSNVIPAEPSMDLSGGTVEQHPATVEETLETDESSDSECESDNVVFYQNLFMVCRLGLRQAYDRESEAAHAQADHSSCSIRNVYGPRNLLSRHSSLECESHNIGRQLTSGRLSDTSFGLRALGHNPFLVDSFVEAMQEELLQFRLQQNFKVSIPQLTDVDQLMLLVYKLLLLVLEVNAASTKVTTAQRLRLLKEFLLSRDG